MSFDIGRQTEQTFQFWSLTQGRLFTCKGSTSAVRSELGFLYPLLYRFDALCQEVLSLFNVG
jgi:hypothetical protein